jgi:putative transposase
LHGLSLLSIRYGFTLSLLWAGRDQIARCLIWQSEGHKVSIRYLIHDRNKKFTRSFNAVFWAEGIKVILTPYQASNTNVFAERWIRSAREEYLDQLLIWNEEHPRPVPVEYVDYYNTCRPIRDWDRMPRKT